MEKIELSYRLSDTAHVFKKRANAGATVCIDQRGTNLEDAARYAATLLTGTERSRLPDIELEFEDTGDVQLVTPKRTLEEELKADWHVDTW